MKDRTRKSGLLLLLILGVLILAVLAASYAYYRIQKSELETTAENQLNAIADLKIAQIVRWREERLIDANLILNGDTALQAAKQFLAQPYDEAALDRLSALAVGWKRISHYSHVVLLNPEMEVKFTSPVSEAGIDAATQSVARNALRENKILICDLHHNTAPERVCMEICIPLMERYGSTDFQGAKVGVIILEIDPFDFIFPHIQSWPMPSSTAETLLLRRDGDDVLFLNELRFRSNSALRFRFPIAQNMHRPAVQALLDHRGLVMANDYRGVPVLGVARKIPDSPWYLVAKQDRKEIEAPLHEWLWLIGIGSGILILGVCLAVGFVWKAREVHFTRQELTMRGQASDDIKRSFSLLKATLESTADGILVVDKLGRITSYNDRFASMWRLPKPMLDAGDNKRAIECVVSQLKDSRPFLEKVAELESQPNADSYDVLEFLDGRVFERYSHPQSIDGNAVGRVWSFRDVTERNRAEEALRQSEEKFRSIVESSPTGMYFYELDEDRCLIFRGANPAADRIIGISHESLMGKTIEEAFPNLSTTSIPETYRNVALGKIGTQSFETSYRDGQIKGSYSVTVFKTDSRTIAVTFSDIAERKKAEMERERLTEALRRKNAELENLIYAASHDLRSPLVNIEGFSRRVEKACQEISTLAGEAGVHNEKIDQIGAIAGVQLPKSLGFIRAGVAKMNSLISGLLQLSRLGQAAMHPVDLDMNQLLAQIGASMGYQIQKCKASVTIEPLPRCHGDAQLINQVFSNLFDNALKYRDPTRPLEISVSGRESEGQSIYCVEDNGIGIAQEHQTKIWEMFHRLDPHDAAGGEGIGLNLVNSILAKHNGRIWVESTPGKGSRFHIIIPNSSVNI